MKILLVQTGFIGDVILTTPVIGNMKRLFPDSEISFLTTRSGEELVKFNPDISTTFVFDKRGVDSGFSGLRRMALRLRREQFTLAVSLHKSWRTAFLLRTAEIPERIGFREAHGTMLYTKTVRRRDLSHEVLRNLAILRAFGREPETLDQTLRVVLPPKAEDFASSVLKDTNSETTLVGLAPGSVWRMKQWPCEYFTEVARCLAARGWRIIVLGSSADESLGDEIHRSVGGDSVLNLAGRASLIESAAVISRLSLLISNDSAPLHLASAFRVPVIALFCATVPEFGFGPWQTPSEVLGMRDLYCRPCGRHGLQQCPTGTERCRRDLLPTAVLSAVERLRGSWAVPEGECGSRR